MQITVEQITNGYLVTEPPAGQTMAPMPGNTKNVKTACATLADLTTLIGQIMPEQTTTDATGTTS